MNLISDEGQVVAKAIFENLRNVLVCVAIAVAGLAMPQYPKVSALGSKLAPTMGFLLFLVATLLFIWNCCLGIHSLAKDAKFWSFKTFFVLIPATIVYATLAVSIIGATLAIQSSQLHKQKCSDISTVKIQSKPQ